MDTPKGLHSNNTKIFCYCTSCSELKGGWGYSVFDRIPIPSFYELIMITLLEIYTKFTKEAGKTHVETHREY